MARQSSNWTDQEKERAWKCVQIRFLQIFTIYVWNAKGKNAATEGGLFEPEIRLLENSAMESTCMSIRDIDDFFDNSSSPRPDDLRVTDFGKFLEADRYLTDPERTIINKALAHLTDFRVSGTSAQDKLDGIDIISRAVGKIEKFLDFLAIELSSSHPQLDEGIQATKSFLNRRLNDLKQDGNYRFIISADMLSI